MSEPLAAQWFCSAIRGGTGQRWYGCGGVPGGGHRVVPAAVVATEWIDQASGKPSVGAGPMMIACAPAHQFPLGMQMSPRRGVELIRRARAGAWIVEDDDDGELRHAGGAELRVRRDLVVAGGPGCGGSGGAGDGIRSGVVLGYAGCGRDELADAVAALAGADLRFTQCPPRQVRSDE